jgi:dipeptidyl aminopeptidase/acylaminoacyl peptidase
MRGLWLAAAGAIASAAGQAHAGEALTPEALWDLARLSSPALSPRGDTAVVRVARYDAQTDARVVDLWLAPLDGAAPPRRLTQDPGPENAPQWSPDGKALAFLARRGADEADQVYLITETGPARRLTDAPGGVSALRWRPDGRGLIFATRIWEDLAGFDAQRARAAERAAMRATARTWTRPPVAIWDQWTDDRTAHLFAVDLAGALAPLTQRRGPGVHTPALAPASFDIAPDGRELVYVADSDASGVRPNLDIYALSLVDDAPARNLTADNPQDDDEPLYSPDGGRIAFLRQTIRGFYADRQRLMILNRTNGALREVAPGWDRSAEGLVWAPDGTALYGAIDDSGERAVYRLSLDGAPPQRLTKGADFRALDIVDTMRGPAMIALREKLTEPAVLVRLDPKTGASTPLTNFNDALMGAVSLGAVESVVFPGAAGAPVQMWVVKPPGFDPAKRYPLFLLLHGGPHNAITNAWSYRWSAQAFAAWGYVVAWPNFHGSSGFGQAFADSINPNRADLPYADAIAATRWFMDKPWIDRERMVAGGGSYGGYLATVILGRAHPFKAIVAHAPVYNVFTQVAADYGREQDRFVEPWDAPADVLRYSPNMAAANFTTPTLVIHGELDYRVPIAHSVELFHTLQRRGVASKLVTFPDEGHWILGRSNSLFWYETVRDWIATYAPPGPTTDAPPKPVAVR